MIYIKYDNRLEEVITNNQGIEMKIIKYNKSKDIDVEFEDGYISKNKTYSNFKRGNIKNPYHRSLYGKGYIGIGKYLSSKGSPDRTIYYKWCDIFKRSYSIGKKGRNDTYNGCSVDEKWYCLQDFGKWYDDNLWSEDCTYLDKDILFKGNKVYSPDRCVLVDNRLNCMFTKTNKKRGLYPIGVYYKKDIERYRSQCSIVYPDGHKQQKFLGDHDDPLSAFYEYKKFKEQYIKQIADEYKQKYPKFPNNLYEAMYNYKVEITD